VPDLTKDTIEIGRDMRAFAHRWQDVASETGDKQSFWDELFAVYGFDRKGEGAQYEFPVKMRAGSKTGFIDLYAPTFGFLMEGKSAGKDLNVAMYGDKKTEGAETYWDALPSEGRPRYLVASDFHNFWVADTTKAKRSDERLTTFTLTDLADRPALLTKVFASGSRTAVQVDVAAAEIMANLYDTLSDELDAHDLSMWLTRILFCLYAEDTGIFPSGAFTEIVEHSVRGTLDGALQRLFDILNKPEHRRNKRTSPALLALPYVNGNLFADNLAMPTLGPDQHQALLAACHYNWNGVNPTIFGAMFQNAMSADRRRSLGEHYTSEDSILRTLKPLILDDLEAEYTKAVRTGTPEALNAFHDRIAALQFLDPAAGCGNFLLVAYRELRILERRMYREALRWAKCPTGDSQAKAAAWRLLDREPEVRVKVSSFHGIEIGEFPARIGEVAVYLEQHRQDQALSSDLAMEINNLPLIDIADMHIENAATLDWSEVVKPSDDLVIVGNPPYKGGTTLSKDQQTEHDEVWADRKLSRRLDYVSIWFRKAAELTRGTKARTALVSTSSICQGEQVAPLWGWMHENDMSIDFAHQTFSWSNEARGMAHVHVIIVGFSDIATERPKRLFTYDGPNGIKGAPNPVHGRVVPVINSYLAPAADIIVQKTRKPLTARLGRMRMGCMAADGGHLILSPEEAVEARRVDPIAARYIRRFGSGDDMFNDTWRYCLWLVDATEQEMADSPVIRRHVAACRDWRAAQKQGWGAYKARVTPHLFKQRFEVPKRYVGVCRHQSENRDLLLADVTEDVILSDANYLVESDDAAIFAVISSRAYRAWAMAVGGRLESRIRLSTDLVHHAFTLPDMSDDSWGRLRAAGEKVLAARTEAGGTLAGMYKRSATPEVLLTAHAEMDALVDEALGLEPGSDDIARLAALFNAYAERIRTDA
jgi:hypothetical protein